MIKLAPKWRRVALAVAITLIIGVFGFFYMFPWALENEAEAGVAGPNIPAISMRTTGNSALHAYARICSYCHDRGIGPDLRKLDLDGATVTMFVRHGNGPMPSFRPTEINDADLAALAKMIAKKQLPVVQP